LTYIIDPELISLDPVNESEDDSPGVDGGGITVPLIGAGVSGLLQRDVNFHTEDDGIVVPLCSAIGPVNRISSMYMILKFVEEEALWM